MEENTWFEDWFNSPYYKVLYQNRDMIEASEFINTLLQYLQPLPGSKMLDIACGEGRFSIQLADKGYDVTGIDIAANSIATANKKAHGHLHFFVHDMRLPFHTGYFDYAFNFFTSFGYFENPADNFSAAKSFAETLKKGGILVIDYLNKEYVIRNLVPEETIIKNDMVFNVRRSFNDNYIFKEITLADTEGKEHHFKEQVSAFELKDFIAMFAGTGMALVGTFGNYMLQTYQPFESPRLIMIFKKK